jgi:general secretion pathway protein F
MAEFEVRWMQGGAVATRRVEAPNAQAIARTLQVAPTQIIAVRPIEAAVPKAARGRNARFPLRLFSKELAVLLGAGIPLLEAITTLREKEPAACTAAALSAIGDRLQAGEALSVALAAQPAVFDTLFVAVIASAERTGQLREALAAHAQYLDWAETLRERLVSASVYPLILIVSGSAVVLFLLIYVVPRFAGLLDGVGGDMPAASRALLALGGWTGAHPLLSVVLAAALLSLPWFVWQQPALRARAGALMWSVPVFASRLRLLALARLYRTLSMLLGAGVPVVLALRTARGVIAPHLRPALDAATAAVERGERLSDVLDREGLGTPVSVRMVRVGERSGSVGPMLGQAAAFYDEELARITDLVTKLINPLLMLVMGGVIGAVVVLMYLPIFQLMEQVQ